MKIIVYDLNYIGDLVMSSPVYRALRIQYPTAKIDCFCFSDTKDVPYANPFIDEIHETERNRVLQVIDAVRLRGYHVAIQLNTSFWTNLLMWLSGAKERIGYSYKWKGLPLTTRVHTEYPTARSMQRTDECLKLLPFHTLSPSLIYEVSAIDKKEALFFLRSCGVKEGSFVAGLHVCCRKKDARKRYWMVERWAEIGDFLIERYNAWVVFTGLPSDREYILSVCDKMVHKERIIIQAGHASLNEFAASLDLFNIFITVNTSSMHIAAARNTPTVALIGGTPASVVCPHQDNFVWVEDEGLKDYDPLTGWYRPNMSSITTDEVKLLIEGLLHEDSN